jgi:hypothetical protein
VTDLLVFVALVAVIAVVGVGVGMLVARPLGRLIDRSDEAPGDDDRPDD